MKKLLLSLKTETETMRRKMQTYAPWLFAGSFLAKLILIALFFTAPNCAHADQSVRPDILVDSGQR